MDPEEQNEEKLEEAITLLDVFEKIERKDSPDLWGVVLKLLAIMPTTVGCERGFSILKRKLHPNMKKENAIVFIQNAQQRDEFKFIECFLACKRSKQRTLN